MKMNEMYVAPELEVLEVMVEHGFQATGGTGFETEENPLA